MLIGTIAASVALLLVDGVVDADAEAVTVVSVTAAVVSAALLVSELHAATARIVESRAVKRFIEVPRFWLGAMWRR